MSNDDIHRHRSCTNKQRFATRAEAEAVAEKATREWNLNETVWLNVYLCPYCRQFHLGRNYDGPTGENK